MVKSLPVMLVLGCAVILLPSLSVRADPLTIYEIQYTTYEDGGSEYDGLVVDCAGGIVTAKYVGTRPRVILQDPDFPDGWGAIQVKDWSPTRDLVDHVMVGDRIALTNVEVEEFRGTTMLQWYTANNPDFDFVSHANPLPPPILVSVSDIPAPVYDAYWDEWFVEDHEAEHYESMRLIVRDVTVTQKHLGKAVDNYNLQTSAGQSCWASDYMNANIGPWDYHDFVDVGQHFCAVAGVFEQYTRVEDGWDYYQLLTRSTGDLAICGDGDGNGLVDLDDVPRSHECLTGPVCDGAGEACDLPAWTGPPLERHIQHCLMMDMDYDGDVDLEDIKHFQAVFGAE